MATPEQEQLKQPEVQTVPEQIPEDVAERLAEQGVTATQTLPKKLTDDQGQTIAQPVADPSDDDLAAGVVVPFGEEEAASRKKRKPNDSLTWLAMLVEKFIKIAKHTHKKIFIKR